MFLYANTCLNRGATGFCEVADCQICYYLSNVPERISLVFDVLPVVVDGFYNYHHPLGMAEIVVNIEHRNCPEKVVQTIIELLCKRTEVNSNQWQQLFPLQLISYSTKTK